MHKRRTYAITVILIGLWASVVTAEDPTFSVEVSAINGVKLETGPAASVTASPGDLLRVDIYLRDWSKDGEPLRAYQAALDRRGFSSGFQGTIQPVDYEINAEVQADNKSNCFVESSHPRYVFLDRKNFGITDTVSPDYRWLGALLDVDDAIVSAQDGTKFYTGTVIMTVSEDASGPFTLRLREEGAASSIRDDKAKPIMGLSFEVLEVAVGPKVLRLLSSDPPSGVIDARQVAIVGADGAIDKVVLRFNMDTSGLTAEDFAIGDGTDDPPQVKNLIAGGQMATLELDRAISPRAWTTIMHSASGFGVRIGCLPGDVNNDGVADPSDVVALLQRGDGADALPMSRTDLNRDGAVNVADAIAIVELLTQPDAHRAKMRK